MTSVQILQQFLNKSLLRPTAEKQLNVLVAKALYPETAKARAALVFIIRYTQYNAGEITSDELLLSLRDTILFLGKFSVPKALFDLTSTRGKHYDLICEPDQFVACEMKFPAWFNDFEFVNQVYGFDIEPDALTQESVADDILKAKTVYSDYKSFEQKAAVYSAMKLQPGCTLLISLPTGSGKSLVTQMLALESPGLTLVIVPTVALALDQYNAAITSMTDAQAYGIFCYRGEQDVSDYHKIIDALKARKANLLFTSPEAILRNPTLHKVLEECAADHYIDNLVIDEAHIVPDWGTFFRPDFQVLSVVLNKWKRLSNNHIRTYLLSATLSDDVVSSLKRLYSHDDRFYEFRCDSLRREPKFCYYPAKTRNEQDEKLLDLVVKLPKPMIVYVLEPEEAVRVKKLLKEISMKNVPVFSGKTNDSQRGIILKGWKNGQYDIVVATSAFGIGVDKPDVRTIIHKCTPENLSRFYQEVGRAGRDGMPSLSVLLPYVGRTDGESDLSKAFGLVNKRVLRVDSIVTRWFSMTRSSKSDVMGDSIILDTAVPPSTFTEEEVEYAGNRNVAWNVNLILLLLRTEFIDITDVFYSNETRSYHFSVKLLRLADMRDEETLAASLSEPRQNELDSQLEGYFLMRDLVQKPERACWGSIFKKLFPLAKERCNGCPKNKEIISASEDRYKIRVNPGIPAVSEHSSPALRRIMGGYNRFILRKNEPYDADVSLAIKQMEKIGVGALVIPDELKKCIGFSGMVLTHDEFLLLADYSPSLFAGGCMTVFQNDAIKNNALFLANQSLERHGYRMVYYCDEDMFISSLNRDISNFLDCYIKDAKNL